MRKYFLIAAIFATVSRQCVFKNLNSVRPKTLNCGSQSEIGIWFSEEKIFWKNTQDKASWTEVPFPSQIKASSNPAIVCTSNYTGILFVQSTDGQIYNALFTHKNSEFDIDDWKILGNKLPYDEGFISNGHDGVVINNIGDTIYVFARSFTNTSRLYSMTLNLANSETTAWIIICGEEAALMTDASVAFNSFTNLLEAFMVSEDNYLYRCWQTSASKWSTWDKTGYSAPKTIHAPVVHAMDTNVFNGRLNVFVHGIDNKLHHIWQTTCDKVPNPWGWCTWSVWYTIGDDLPQMVDVVNSVTVGRNLHLGIELFVVSAKGSLYKLWQLDRHKEWSNWEKVYSNNEYSIASLPSVSNRMLWWTVYALDNETNLLAITQNHTFSLSPSTVGFSDIAVASWEVPVDEASNKDWIAIYRSDSEQNEEYLDYSYVGGSQNPLSQPVPSGHVAFNIYLPKGSYRVKYLVDKQFISVADKELTVTSSSSEKEWVQIFRGIFIGLNIHNVSIEQCVKDAESIPDAFRKAFQEFNDRFIYTGLHDLGSAVAMVIKSIKDCGIEKAFIERIEVFMKDLIACAQKGSCTHFVIDVGKEVLVLYENIYEIYSDIRAASNCFNINAYAQGAYNIGRVIGACIALPR